MTEPATAHRPGMRADERAVIAVLTAATEPMTAEQVALALPGSMRGMPVAAVREALSILQSGGLAVSAVLDQPDNPYAHIAAGTDGFARLWATPALASRWLEVVNARAENNARARRAAEAMTDLWHARGGPGAAPAICVRPNSEVKIDTTAAGLVWLVDQLHRIAAGGDA